MEDNPGADKKAEVDLQVQEMGTQVITVLTNITSGTYEEILPSTDVKIYRENDEVKSVVINKNVTGDRYTHILYCDGGDAHELFFSDGTMIRWEYYVKPRTSRRH